jgi:hypothetical protein
MPTLSFLKMCSKESRALANCHVNRTAEKLRFSVRSGLPPPPAGYVER